jgi:uncharacterized membrane protein
MSGPGIHYFPHPPSFLAIFALLLVALMLLLRFVAVDYAFVRLGLSRKAALALLWLSLIGSAVNIPVAQVHNESPKQDEFVDAFGLTYVVPRVVEQGRTVVAINVGGAVIPVLLCVYLIARLGLQPGLVAALVVVTGVVHIISYPVKGVGIAMPPLIAPLVAAGCGLLLDRQRAPRTAFVAGAMGTLIGADLMNVGSFDSMGAPVVSIGGAGTFDGVFATGVVAVLLAGFFLRRARTPSGTG